jgi:hypothetical protein
MNMPDANIFLDKRAHTRVPAKIPVSYRVMEDHKEISNIRELGTKTKVAQTQDTSLGGMFIVGDETFKMGDILNLKISIPARSLPLSAFAEVVWSNVSGAGLHFLAMKEEDTESLEAYIQDLSKR